MNTGAHNAEILQTRLATESDCAELTQLCFRSKQSNGYDSAFMEACCHELRVTNATLTESECSVVHHQQSLCACGCLTIADTTIVRNNSVGEITLFFVDPDWQHRGVGKLLWQCLLQRAQFHQLDVLTLDADPSAEGFYSSLGCETVGQSPSGSIPGRYLPQMRLTNF